MRKLNLRLVAFLLILVFSQKMGVRLWLHTCLHVRVASPHNREGVSWSQMQPQCSCMDDLMMPLVAAKHFELSLPVSNYPFLTAAGVFPFISVTRHYPCLRGPPGPPVLL